MIVHYDSNTKYGESILKGEILSKPYNEIFTELYKIELNDDLKKEKLKLLVIMPLCYNNKIIGCFNFSSHYFSSIPAYIQNAIESITSQMGGVTARLDAEQKVIHSLNEKVMLLKEIHHRVKNNMQIISSMIDLKTADSEHKDSEIFKDIKGRIFSMAVIHEMFYKSDNLGEIDFSEFLSRLSYELSQSYPMMEKIKFDLDTHDIKFDINIAIPCSLIIFELVTNAIKHAFPDEEKGEIYVHVSEKDENTFLLVVKDNGIGLPESFDLNNIDSLGFELVNALAKQVDGEISIESDNGVKVSIIINSSQ